MGFQWIDGSDCENSVISFMRKGRKSQDQLLVVCNFTPIVREKYRVGVPCLTAYTEIVNSDAIEFGGTGKVNLNPIKAKKVPWSGQPCSLELTLPPLSVMIFKFGLRKSKKKGTRR